MTKTISGRIHKKGDGDVVGLDINEPTIIKPGTIISAEGTGRITATRIGVNVNMNEDTKELILRGRARNINGIPTWHDSVAIQNALIIAVQGMSIVQAGLLLRVATKLEEAQVLQGNFPQELPDIKVELTRAEEKKLWQILPQQPCEAFGRRIDTFEPAVPPAGLLGQMFADIASQLGRELPEDDD